MSLRELSLGLLLLPALAQPQGFVNFEGAQTNPIRISSDGTRLFAVNTPNATLSVFDLTQPASPTLIREIPVGIEPVSVNINPNVAGNDEAWVVNQISNSVSVVSVSRGIVTDTIPAKTEPADVVFTSNGFAFVSVGRSNMINVYNAATHVLAKTIPLAGEEPRALAVNPKGTMVFAAFALSGNQTTIVPATLAPPQPIPSDFNTALPPPPQVSLIVSATDPTWSSVIRYSMPDHDVAAISANTFKVFYFSHLGTDNFGLTVNPVSGNVYVANTDALNLVMYQTALDGHIVNHQITSLNPVSGQSQVFDLNPGIDYNVLPNPAALATALAMPTAVVFEPTGRYLYIAAFGTDRVGIFDTSTNTVSGFIEIDPQAIGAIVNPASKRGPRGLALNSRASVLYTLNRISNTISVVNLTNNTVSSEIPSGSYDPTPPEVSGGRGFLYDHKLSGNGTGACASCHVDAEMDLLAWNLGDPTGSMSTLQEGTQLLNFHPMKGPMVTQTLRGLVNLQPYHWRGDKPDLAAFNIAFASLLGGQQLSDTDMTSFANYMNTIAYQPNPNLNLDGTFPATLPLPDVRGVSGSPAQGQTVFQVVPFNAQGQTCNTCHTSNPGPGTNLQVAMRSGGGPNAAQPFKVPQLRNLYQKTNTNFKTGAASVNGFGLAHDGTVNGLFALTGQSALGTVAHNNVERKNIEAFILCFDTGTPPATGYSRTLSAVTVNTVPAQSDWNTLQILAAAGTIDLIVNGTIQGQVEALVYQPANNSYQTNTAGVGPFTQANLANFVQTGDTLTIMGVPAGLGSSMAANRKLAKRR